MSSTITFDSIQGLRSYQQDRVATQKTTKHILPENTLLIVCDGMGGVRGDSGELADEVVNGLLLMEPQGAKELLDAINIVGTRSMKKMPGGTTCMALLIEDDQATLVSVGDSRTYLFRNGQLKQLTIDETVLQARVDAGAISQEDADEGRDSYGSNRLTNCIGAGITRFKTTVLEFVLESGDCILMATDGLWDSTGNSWLQAQLQETTVAKDLCARALAAGSRDNITAIVYTHKRTNNME